MLMHRTLYINGAWCSAGNGKTFPTLNPATERTVALCAAGTKEDVTKAIDAAEHAYARWSATPAPKRARVLLRAARIMEERKHELGSLVTTEMGKVLPEGLSDVQEAIDTLDYFAGEGRRLFGRTTPSELPNKFAFAFRKPIGVCGIITPWNFPIAIPAWKIAPALVCGNTVVFKPASDTPLCAVEYVKILAEAGLPKGVLNMVTGSADVVGKELVTSRRIRCLSFTGSRSVGEWIAKNAGLKKLGLELGGKNPIIIMDDADLRLALEGVLWSAFGTTGQRCTAASRVIVHAKVKKKFQSALIARAKRLRLGPGLDKRADVGPLINAAAVEKVHRYTQLGTREGARLLCGGSAPKRKGFFYSPTIFTNVTQDMRIAQEEIFGPTLSVIECNSLDDAIDIANSIEYGLSSSIYTHDINRGFRAIEKLESGLTYVNAGTIGSEVHLPFGGFKSTGNGTREAGWTGIDEFSELKTVYVDYSGKLQKAQWE